MQKLIEGYRRFRTGLWQERQHLFTALAASQQPRAAIIACCDSRADPAAIFDTAPGELFVIRNVANLVPPYAPDAAYHGTSAALEFAICALNVPDLIVMGHSGCGGIRTLIEADSQPASDFIAPWMTIAAPARQKALTCTEPQEALTCCAQEAVRLSLQNLLTFPWIADRVAIGKLTLHGAYFDIATGQLLLLQSDSAGFAEAA